MVKSFDRLPRIDTPERGEKGYREATEGLRKLLGGKSVILCWEEPGKPARDRFGRLFAYVYVEDTHVNVEMVRRGWSTF